MNSGVSERVHAAFDSMVERFRVRSLIAMFCLLATPIWAQDHNSDLEVTQPADSAGAPSEWRRMAEQGQAAAQYNLGIMYEYGRGVRQNDVEAARWYRKASVQGVSVAQYKLGIMYDNGWGVPHERHRSGEVVQQRRGARPPFGSTRSGFHVRCRNGCRARLPSSIYVAQYCSRIRKQFDDHTPQQYFRASNPAQIVEAQEMTREWMEESSTLEQVWRHLTSQGKNEY